MAETSPQPRSRIAVLAASPAVRGAADAAGFSMLAVAAVGLAVYGGRREIGRELAQDWLRERGIESGFVIERVDAGAFVGSVRLGPRNDPVFAADRVEVAYDLTPPWSGSPFKLSTQAVRLVRPRVKVGYDGKRFSAGVLDPLIRDFLSRPKTAEPGPAVLIEDARVTVMTPNGALRLTGDGAIDNNQLLRFDGRLLPASLKGRDFVADTQGGSVRLRKAGQALTADVRLAGSDYSGGGVDLEGADAAIEGTVPYPNLDAQTLEGLVSLRAAVRADRLAMDETSAGSFEANVRLQGQVGGPFAKPVLTGGLTGLARADTLTTAGLTAREALADVVISRLGVVKDEAGFQLTGAATLDAHARQAAAGGAALTGASLGLTAPSLSLVSTSAGITLDTPFSGQVGASGTVIGDLTLSAASAKGSGRLRSGANGLILTAQAGARATGTLPAARARQIAADLPVVGQDPAQTAAIAAALQRFDLNAPGLKLAVGDSTTLSLTAPATVASVSGGRVVVSPRGGPLLVADGGAHGAFDVAVNGGGLPRVDAQVSSWSAAGGGLDAQLAVNASLDAPPAEDAEVKAAGRLHMAGGRTTFALSDCAVVSAKLVDFGETDVTGATARVCSSGGPLVSADDGGWRLAGRFEGAAGDVPAFTVAASGASGTFAVGGRDDLDRAAIVLAAAQVADTEAAKRFQPLRLSGRVALAGGVWRGAFPVASGSGRPVAVASLEHNVAADAGRMDVDATALAFDPKGLQPAELSPLAEAVRNADGPAPFTGRFAWTAEGSTSSGELTLPGLSFASPAGTVTGLKTRIVFTSLAPLISAPDQQLTIERVNAVTPLEAVSATFDMDAQALHIDAATAKVARGMVSLEPTVVPLGEAQTISGAAVLSRVDIGTLVASSTLADKIKVAAVVDGRLPFTFGPEGLRFIDGHVEAVQPGRISIDRAALSNVQSEGAAPANPMDATAPTQEVNAIQDFAYQAMENLAFDTLEAKVNSAPGGRLSLLFRIKGKHDPKVPEQARVGIRELLTGKAFQRRIPLPEGTPIDLTLDTSLNFDELLRAWQRQWADAP